MVLDFIFGFLLNYTPAVSILIFSLVVLFLINIFYKILINQEDARQLKLRQQGIAKQMREEQKAGNTKKANELLNDMMHENAKLMKMTLKPMIVSFVIVIVFIPWLVNSYGDIFVKLENNVGSLKINGNEYKIEKMEDSLNIIKDGSPIKCRPTCLEKIEDKIFEISQESQNIKFAPVVAQLPIPLPFVGDTLGWLGWYILVSVPLVMLMRKFMKIYI